MGGIWFGVCWRSISVWLWQCGVFMQSEALLCASLRLAGCYFMGGIRFGVCWRSVSVWLWQCGVFMQSEALLCASDCIKTPHRHSHTETERQHTPNQIAPMK